jgi:hypothetical protein
MGLCTARMSSYENIASLFRQTFELALDHSFHLQNPPVVLPFCVSRSTVQEKIATMTTAKAAR